MDGALTGAPGFRERAPWWGGDLQTVRNQIARRPGAPSERSTRIWIETGDGDRLAGLLDAPARPDPGAPLVVLVHGLTGDENSVYLRRSAAFHLARGRMAFRLNLRGAGPSQPVCRGRYHAGRAADLQTALEGLPAGLMDAGVFVVGYSLGGAIAINWLASHADPARILGAASVSAPLDPLAASRRLAAPRNAVYQAWLLRAMRAELLSSPAPLSERERAAAGDVRSVFEFDDALVAPRNGYDGALDYYARTAAGPSARRARAALLAIHADNDPWIPAEPYRALAAEAPQRVTVALTRGGGHVGFHGRGDRTPWFDRAIDGFLTGLARR